MSESVTGQAAELSDWIALLKPRVMTLVVFLYVVFRTFTSKEHLADNYWGEGATTLEWTVSSPPPFHTFAELPRIR